MPDSKLEAGSGNDEEDFMSDKFLAQLSDVRPGLRTNKRHKGAEHAIESQQQPKKNKGQHSLRHAQEALLVAMATPLDCGGQGSAMMARMGYRPGTGLGRCNQGRLEPVPLSIKSDRSGLGLRSHHPSVPAPASVAAASADAPEACAAASAASAAAYRGAMRAKFSRADARWDLERARRACMRLDEGANLRPPADWFWPPSEDSETADSGESDEPEEEAEEVLALVASRLRLVHLYCLWCGREFESQGELAAECPGEDRLAHDQ